MTGPTPPPPPPSHPHHRPPSAAPPGRGVGVRDPGPLTTALVRFWRGWRAPVPARVLAASATVGLLGGAVLVGRPPGAGAAAVGALLWAGAAWSRLRPRGTADVVSIGLSVCLVAVVAVRDAGWVVALCLATASGTAAVAATSARSAPAVVLAVAGSAAGVLRAVPWLARGAGALTGRRRAQLVVAARTLAVTVGLVVVFGALLGSADPVFASLLPRVDPGTLPARVVVGALVALAAGALAHAMLEPPPWAAVALPPGRPARRAEWLVPVGALAALVLAFVLVQAGALLGGHRHVLRSAGLTYAQYAREGFGQLLVVTALTLVVVAVAARRAPRATATDRLVSRAALGALCLGTLGVVASALRRMDLYVDAFGLTRLRLLAVAVEVGLGLVLVLVLIAGVRWRGGWLPRAALHVAGVTVLALAAVDPDAQIVRHNAAAPRPVDVAYLRGLSLDAVPAAAGLGEPLRSCLLASAGAVPSGDVLGWNLGRERAARVLAESGPDAGDLDACLAVAARP